MTVRQLLGALVLLSIVACEGSPTPDSAVCRPGQATFDKQQTLQVEIAATDAERQKGLMGVTRLPENHGMAFVWDEPTDGTFWMKDTLIPLSIAFVGQDGRVVTIQEMTPCSSEPCQTYASSAPYTWAVEANMGWFEQHGVDVGEDATLLKSACV